MSFSASGGTLTTLFTTTSFPSIAQMVLDEISNVLYCVNGGSTILCRRLNSNTTIIFTISPSLSMYGIAIYKTNLYVSSYNDDRVYRVSLSTLNNANTNTTLSLTSYTLIRSTSQSDAAHNPGLICFDSRSYLYCGNWTTNTCTVFNTNDGSTIINFIGTITSTSSFLRPWSLAVNYNPSPIDNKRYIWFFAADGCRAGFTDVTNISGNITGVPIVSSITSPVQYNSLNSNGPAPTVNSLGRVYMAVSSTSQSKLTRSVMTLNNNLASSNSNVFTHFIGVNGRFAVGDAQPPTFVLPNTNDTPSCIFCSLDNDLYIYCDGTGNFYEYTFPPPTIGSLILSQAFVDTPLTITQPSSNSGGSFTYSSSNVTIATVSGNIITPVSIGTCVITARQNGYDNYSVGTVTATLTVNEGAPPPVNNDISKIALYSISSFSFV